MAKSMKFEDKMDRLKEIVDSLQSEKTDLDDSIKLYEEGLKLTNELQEQLKSFEDSVKKISKE